MDLCSFISEIYFFVRTHKHVYIILLSFKSAIVGGVIVRCSDYIFLFDIFSVGLSEHAPPTNDLFLLFNNSLNTFSFFLT